MTKEPLIVAEREHELLKKHCHDAILTDYNKAKLLSELASARILPKEELPIDVVRVHTKVAFKEATSGQRFAFEIVWPNEADISQKKMSALAPLSIALLGYRQGAQVDWEMPAGIKRFEILEVAQA